MGASYTTQITHGERPPGPRPALTPSTPASWKPSSAGNPPRPFDTGIRKTVQWYLDHPRLGGTRAGAVRTGSGCKHNTAHRPPHEDPPARQETVRSAGSCSAALRHWANWSLWTATAPKPTVAAATSRTRKGCDDTVQRLRPTVIVNAAAHDRRGQGRERKGIGTHHQRRGAWGVVSRRRATWAPCWFTTPPTMCLTAAAHPLARRCRHRPAERIRPDQARWRTSHRRQRRAATSSFAPAGCMPRAAATSPRPSCAWAQERDRLTVIDDQHGAPTGADLIADVTAHAIRQALRDPATQGTYHLSARRRNPLERLCALCHRHRAPAEAHAGDQGARSGARAHQRIPHPRTPAAELAAGHHPPARHLWPRAARLARGRAAHAHRNPLTHRHRMTQRQRHHPRGRLPAPRLHPATLAISKQLLPGCTTSRVIYIPAHHADARRHPRCADHQHAAGHAALSAVAWRRQRLGHEPASTRCSPARTAWHRPSSSALTSSATAPARWCWATTSTTATTSPRCSPAPTRKRMAPPCLRIT